MAFITDPVVISTIAQTIVLTLTLIIFTMSFRSQNKAIQEDAYQKVLDDYNDAMRMLIERPELYNYQVELLRMNRLPRGGEQKPYSREDMVIRSYVIMLYGLFERLHFLYRKKWIDKDTWSQWSAFLEIMSGHPVFRDVHQSSQGMFDKPFQDYVHDIYRKKESRPRESSTSSVR